MKHLLAGLITVLFLGGISTTGFAVAPENSLWYEPLTSESGEAITLSAFVYNNTTSTVSAFVEFKADNTTVIGTKRITITPQGGTTAIQAWKMPSTKTTIIATLVSVTDQKNIALKNFDTAVGTLIIDPSVPTPAALPFELRLRSWWSNTVKYVEDWRLINAQHCTEKKAAFRAALGIDDKVPVGKDLLPLGPNEKPSTDTVTHLTSPGDYAGLIWNSACSFFLANEFVFYISVGLILLVFLRMIMVMIF